MSAVHIDLIVGNRHNVHNHDNEGRAETIGGRQPLPHKAENLSADILGIRGNLSERLAESIAEDITKIRANESAQS